MPQTSRAKWRANETYSPNSSHAVWQWQHRFLDAVREQCPQVLGALFADVLPAYERALKSVPAMVGFGRPEGRAALRAKVRRVDSSREEACEAARTARHSWAREHNLEAPFVLAAARDTIAAWTVRRPVDGSNLNWVVPPLMEQTPERQRAPIASWDSRRESLAAFRARIEGEIASEQRWAREVGLVPGGFGERERYFDYHFRWLAHWQVLRRSGEAIGAMCRSAASFRPDTIAPPRPGHQENRVADLDGRVPRSRGTVSRTTVETAVKELVRALGLPKRRGNRGRPRK